MTVPAYQPGSISPDSSPAGLDVLTGTETTRTAPGVTGADKPMVWGLLAVDAAVTALLIWGVLTGHVAALLDSTRWPHLGWLLAGAATLALLMGTGEDIRRCYRTTRRNDHGPGVATGTSATTEGTS